MIDAPAALYMPRAILTSQRESSISMNACTSLNVIPYQSKEEEEEEEEEEGEEKEEEEEEEEEEVEEEEKEEEEKEEEDELIHSSIEQCHY